MTDIMSKTEKQSNDQAQKLRASARQLLFKASIQPHDEFYLRTKRLLEGRAHAMLKRAKALEQAPKGKPLIEVL
jgi:hypothetical protein